ncbi:IclR family transcriptional regulator C-terminal domain-containing protein [Piscinibacter sakaiensis]|uniref:IclR family transcriptional regulator n=1 Tax=Piscinibacter sakaiensis TaxID=1547922 RepID=UPI003727C8A2
MKGLTLLEALVNQHGKALTIEELRQQLDWSKSNVHRTLQTLAHAQYVAKHELTGTYQPTLKLLELGARLLSGMDVRRLAQPVMRTLGEETGETVNLSILEGLSVVYIETIESPMPIRSDTAIGARAPAHAVATGKALLAFQYEGYLARHADELRSFTPTTLATLPALKDELARVRREGHAINHGEWHHSVGGVAAPLFDGLGRLVAAVGISGPLGSSLRETSRFLRGHPLPRLPAGRSPGTGRRRRRPAWTPPSAPPNASSTKPATPAAPRCRPARCAARSPGPATACARRTATCRSRRRCCASWKNWSKPCARTRCRSRPSMHATSSCPSRAARWPASGRCCATVSAS